MYFKSFQFVFENEIFFQGMGKPTILSKRLFLFTNRRKDKQ